MKSMSFLRSEKMVLSFSFFSSDRTASMDVVSGRPCDCCETTNKRHEIDGGATNESAAYVPGKLSQRVSPEQ